MAKALFLFLFLLCQPAFADGGVQDSCLNFADPVRVKVGDAEFRIPAAFHPILFINKNGGLFPFIYENCRCVDAKTKSERTGYCQEAKEPAFELAHVTINPTNDAKIGEKSQQVQVFLDNNSAAKDLYCEAAENFKKNKKPLESKKNWFVSEGKYGKHYSLKDLSLFSSPIYLECVGTVEQHKNDSCVTSFPLTQESSITVRFHTDSFASYIPMENWVDVFKEIELFLKKIMVNPPKNKPISCTPESKERK